MHAVFSRKDFHSICELLSKKDETLKAIITEYGLPPMWTRPPIFQSLILTILEQQVSLASAYSAFKKLKEKIGFVTPKKILALTDAELKACYFSRQKIVYVHALATAIVKKKLTLKKLASLTDEEIRTELKKLKALVTGLLMCI